MLKNIIGGIAIGIANVIPGVSGGTMMVILGIFNRMMDAISGVFKKENSHRKDDIIFILQVLVGAAIGIIGFAKILEVLFEYYPTQTIYWFIGLIAFSIPLFIKNEILKQKTILNVKKYGGNLLETLDEEIVDLVVYQPHSDFDYLIKRAEMLNIKLFTVGNFNKLIMA